MSIWQRLFGLKEKEKENSGLTWRAFPPLSAIVLLDDSNIDQVQAILFGQLRLKHALSSFTQKCFPDDDTETLAELIAHKCNFLVSVDTHFAPPSSPMFGLLKDLCVGSHFELIISDSKGFGTPHQYSHVFPRASGLFHIISNIELSEESCKRILKLIPISIDSEPRLAFGKMKAGQYGCALLHGNLVRAHNLVNMDAGRSFHEFCQGIAGRMRKAGIRFEVLKI
ncbi:MAG: hypothetical protein ABSH16_00850 [Sedimentisphaerales bacterium]